MTSKPRKSVILDTNIFVAAGFNPRSHAATLIQAVRAGELTLVWNQRTRAETRKILKQIPPLDWDRFVGLFDDKNEYKRQVDPQKYTAIRDAEDRKFAALAKATGAVLISNDAHLLSVRDALDIIVYTPGEFLKKQ